jgi:hypothetical protein
MGGEEQKPNTKGTDPMKRSYRILTGKAGSVQNFSHFGLGG